MFDPIGAFFAMEPSAQVASVSIMVNLVGGVVGFFVLRRLNRSDEARKTAIAEVQDQRRRNDELKARIDSELLAWGVRSIEAMADAHIFLACRGSGADVARLAAQRDRLQATISALVDRGRLYFPNHSADVPWPNWKGRDLANLGFRDPILDALMIGHEELRMINLSEPDIFALAANNLFRARKAFISELQAWIEPRKLGFGRSLDAGPPRRIEGQEQDWQSVISLVDDIEARYEDNFFWRERPMPRSQLLAELAQIKASV